MIKKNINFQFKGLRNYIQGPDIFNAMIGAFDAERPITNIKFTANSFTSTPACAVLISADRSDLEALADVHAKCNLFIDGQPYWAALVEDASREIEVTRSEYDEEQIISICKIDGNSIFLSAKSPYTFIETIVSMYKFLLTKLFSEVKGKWIFTRVDLNFNCVETNALEVRFKHNLNYKLLKSEIYLGPARIGDLYFSLVDL